MLYILKNITNREKVAFINGLTTSLKHPPLYLNLLYPVKALFLKASDHLFGATILNEDEFLSTTEEYNKKSLNDTDDLIIKKILDNFKEELYLILVNKIKKYQDYDIVLDCLYIDEEIISKLKSEFRKEVFLTIDSSDNVESMMKNVKSTFFVNVKGEIKFKDFVEEITNFVENNKIVNTAKVVNLIEFTENLEEEIAEHLNALAAA